MYLIYGDNKNDIENKLLEVFSSNFKYISNWSDDIDSLISYLKQTKFVNEIEYIKIYINDNTNIETLKLLKSIVDNNKIYICIETKNKLDKKFLNIFNKENIYVATKLNNKSKNDFIINILTKQNIPINNKMISYMHEVLPNDILIIKNELSKLDENNYSNYMQILHNYSTINMFNFYEYFFNKNKNLCIDFILSNLNNMDNAIYFFNTFISKLTNILMIKIMAQSNLSYNEIMKNMHLNAFVFRNDYEYSKKITIQEINYILYNLYKLECDSRVNNINFITILKIFLLNKVFSNNEW